MNIKSRKRFPKKIIIISGVIFLLIVSLLTYVCIIRNNPFNQKSSQNTVRNNNFVDYGPATPEQQQAGNQTKSGSSDTPPAPTPIQGSNKNNVQVTITDASQYTDTVEIRSYVNEVSPTGHCNIQLQKSSSIISRDVDTLTNASTTSCKTVDIPVSEFNSDGSWVVTVTYSSDTATGESTATNVEVKR